MSLDDISNYLLVSNLVDDCDDAQILWNNWKANENLVGHKTQYQYLIPTKIPGNPTPKDLKIFPSPSKPSLFWVDAVPIIYNVPFVPEVTKEGPGVFRVTMYAPYPRGWEEKLCALSAVLTYGYDQLKKQTIFSYSEISSYQIIIEYYTGSELKREILEPEDLRKFITKVRLKSQPKKEIQGIKQLVIRPSHEECSICSIASKCWAGIELLAKSSTEDFSGLRPEEEGSKLQALYEYTLSEEEHLKAKKKMILGRLRALADSGEIPALSGHFNAEFKSKAWYPFEPVFSLLMEAGFWDSSFGQLKAKEIDALLERLPQDLMETIVSYRKEFDKGVKLEWEEGRAGTTKNRASLFGRVPQKG